MKDFARDRLGVAVIAVGARVALGLVGEHQKDVAEHVRHRVALLVPMSGANAGVGQSIANATTLALLDTKTDKGRITT